MITRYFIVNDDEQAGHIANLVPDQDILPLSQLEAVTVATLADGRKVIHAIVPDHIIQDMRELAEIDDPLTIQGVMTLDIINKWGGMDKASVLERYPVLAETMIDHVWSGQD